MREFKMNRELWDEIVKRGRENLSHPEINVLDDADIVTVIATMDFFGASKIYQQQSYWDLKVAKFKVFDWLAMGIMGRNDDDRTTNNVCLQVLVHAFRQANYNEKKFIENLRFHDYDIETDWQEIEINEPEVKASETAIGA